MTKHADTGESRPKGELCVLEIKQPQSGQQKRNERVLPIYDATTLVGLRTIVYDAAIERIEDDGELTIELPKVQELLAASAVSRCLMPIRLRGYEMKAMRKIIKLTLVEMAQNLDERTAPETVSRWESEAQPMGGYAEKVLRLFVCEKLREQAPGVDYHASAIANLKVHDPWRANPDSEVPAIELCLIHMKEQSGTIIDAWNSKCAA
jgi:DNA-binding transcriptional regulator YiaG